MVGRVKYRHSCLIQDRIHAMLASTATESVPIEQGLVEQAVQRKRPLSKYPALYNQLGLMMSKSETPQQLKYLNEKVLANGLDADLIDKLTDKFVELVGEIPSWWTRRDGQLHNALITEDAEEVRIDDDIRFQRYTEMWCRYILILTWTSTEGGEKSRPKDFYQPVDVVRVALEHVDLDTMLHSRFRKLERLGKAARLVDLVEAMLMWLSDGDQDYLKVLGHRFQSFGTISIVWHANYSKLRLTWTQAPTYSSC